MLTNRLKGTLPDVVLQLESAFVPGRLISDNILVSYYELIHFMRHKKKGKQGFAAVKLDMSKAYDRVEWSFLHDIMVKMGFQRRWIDLIMLCVSSVTYRVRVNVALGEQIVAQRGLRQGNCHLTCSCVQRAFQHC